MKKGDKSILMPVSFVKEIMFAVKYSLRIEVEGDMYLAVFMVLYPNRV